MKDATAGVLVQVFSVNLPSQVIVEVVSCGPEPLSRPEMIALLKSAVASLERQDEEPGGRT